MILDRQRTSNKDFASFMLDKRKKGLWGLCILSSVKKDLWGVLFFWNFFCCLNFGRCLDFGFARAWRGPQLVTFSMVPASLQYLWDNVARFFMKFVASRWFRVYSFDLIRFGALFWKSAWTSQHETCLAAPPQTTTAKFESQSGTGHRTEECSQSTRTYWQWKSASGRRIRFAFLDCLVIQPNFFSGNIEKARVTCPFGVCPRKWMDTWTLVSTGTWSHEINGMMRVQDASRCCYRKSFVASQRQQQWPGALVRGIGGQPRILRP